MVKVLGAYLAVAYRLSVVQRKRGTEPWIWEIHDSERPAIWVRRS